MRGLARPSTAVVHACFAPCVWVWGFGSALHCVAWPCFVACVCDCTWFRFWLAGLFFVSLCKSIDCTGLSRDAFISGALRELGVALCRGNASLGRSSVYNLTMVSGQAPLHGLSCPSAEVV
jgi:hypothetical protein